MQPTVEQFTEQAWAATIAAQQLAQNAKDLHLETEHLLLALLQQKELAGRILSKAGVDPGNFQAAVDSHLKRQPSLESLPESVILGRSLSSCLDRAETARDGFSDSYIAIEHLLLDLPCDDRWTRQRLRQAGVDTSKLKQAITACANQPNGDRSEPGRHL